MPSSRFVAVVVAGLAAACGAGRAEAPRAVAAPVPPPPAAAQEPLPASIPAMEAAPAAEGPTEPDLFAGAVKPMLARRCGPCHNPGGQMYDQLPFDQPAVVASRRAAILGRIKDPDDRAPLEAWLARQP
ncbi:MAG TPA: hypothetical protein VII13_16590 [Vicinamibacteria bacterium]|jgi:hypothetical protein